MNRSQVALLGRTTSYRLNAYDDAHIAELLVEYVRDGIDPAGEDTVCKRARHFIEITPEDEQPARLMTLAFTLHWLNGLADLLWARYLEERFRLTPLVKNDPRYGDWETRPVNLFGFWNYLRRGNLEPVHAYTGAATPCTLTPAQTVSEVIRVQHTNIVANGATRLLMLNGAGPGSNHKVAYLHELASTTPHPEAFIKGAAGAQAGAATWDRLFEAYMRLRFGVWGSH